MVELIIVIAIMGVLTGLAGYSIFGLDSARTKSAAINFNSRISSVKSKSKSLLKGNKLSEADVDQMDYYAVEISEDSDGRVHIRTGVKNMSTFTVDSNDGVADDIVLGRRISVTYTPIRSDGYNDTDKSASDGPFYIYFNKRGQCISGAGTYVFTRNGKPTSVTYVRNNGSHEYK